MSEQDEKFMPKKSSSARSKSPSSSAKRSDSRQSSTSKRLPSSAAKRLQYTMSARLEAVNGSTAGDLLQPATQTTTAAMHCSPLRSTTSGMLDCSIAGNSGELFLSATTEDYRHPTEVNRKSPEVSRSPKVTGRSPKAIRKSPKLASSSPEVSRSPRGSPVKRGGLESPAGQPKTKKFIVDRLRKAKTSRCKPVATAAGVKLSSPVRKSPTKNQTGESYLLFSDSFMVLLSSILLIAA